MTIHYEVLVCCHGVPESAPEMIEWIHRKTVLPAHSILLNLDTIDPFSKHVVHDCTGFVFETLRYCLAPSTLIQSLWRDRDNLTRSLVYFLVGEADFIVELEHSY